MVKEDILILACESGKPFADKVFNCLEEIVKEDGITTKVNKILVNEIHFSNSEVKTIIEDSVRGKDVYIFQDVDNSVTDYSVDTNLRAIKTTLDAAHRSGAEKISAILPSFPYARQDRARGREGITAAKVAQELEDHNAGMVISLDIHNDTMAGFFRKAVFESLRASKNIMDYIKNNIGIENLVISSADRGGADRAGYYANRLKLPLIIAHKIKDYDKPVGEQVDKIILLTEKGEKGNIIGKRVFIIDDMVDTASTTKSIVSALKNDGATDIYFGCSLPLFNGRAVERISKLYDEKLLTAIIGTDSVYHGGEEFIKNNPWYREVSVAKYFAKVIFNINQGKSITKLLE